MLQKWTFVSGSGRVRQYNNSFSKGGDMGDFVDNLPVACRIIAIFLFISEKMISFAKYIIEFNLKSATIIQYTIKGRFMSR